MPLELHACAADGCTQACARGYFMCIRHWRMVPAALRRELRAAWAAFRRMRPDAGREVRRKRVHAVRAAQDQAMVAVREKEFKKMSKREESQDRLAF